MIHSAQALRSALQEQGLLPENTAISDTLIFSKPQRPWFINLLLGLSAWVASFFLLGFIALWLEPRKTVFIFICALFLIGTAWTLFKLDRQGAFASQLALAFSFAGQIVLLYVVMEAINGERHIPLVLFFALVLQILMALLMHNYLHRILSIFFACIAWALSVRFGLFRETDDFFTRHLQHPFSLSLGLALSSWALAWSPVAALIYVLIRTETQWMARGWQTVLRPILAGLIIGLAYATVASHPFEAFRWGNNSAQQGWLALWPILALLASLGALISAFSLGSRSLRIACLIALFIHLTHFYYALGVSLLIKSFILILMGSAMLLASQLLNKELPK